MDIIAVGELLVDMAPGEMSEQGNMTFEACPGGAPCNVLALLQKAGHSTGFIGKVGDDFMGHMLKDTIEELGIDSRGLMVDEGAKTTLAFVHKKADGDRDFSFYRKPGADILLREDELDEEYIKSAKVLHFGTLSLTDEPVYSATRKAIEIAKANGLVVSFDPNYREPLWPTKEAAIEQILWGLTQCEILKISDNEVTLITGIEDIIGEKVAVFKKLSELSSAKVIFVTLGPNGSMGWCGEEIICASGVKVEDCIETTGAGDTFMGTALHYLLEKINAEGKLEMLSACEMTVLLESANRTAAQITKVKGALKVMPEVV